MALGEVPNLANDGTLSRMPKSRGKRSGVKKTVVNAGLIRNGLTKAAIQ